MKTEKLIGEQWLRQSGKTASQCSARYTYFPIYRYIYTHTRDRHKKTPYQAQLTSTS